MGVAQERRGEVVCSHGVWHLVGGVWVGGAVLGEKNYVAEFGVVT